MADFDVCVFPPLKEEADQQGGLPETLNSSNCTVPLSDCLRLYKAASVCVCDKHNALSAQTASS